MLQRNNLSCQLSSMCKLMLLGLAAAIAVKLTPTTTSHVWDQQAVARSCTAALYCCTACTSLCFVSWLLLRCADVSMYLMDRCLW